MEPTGSAPCERSADGAAEFLSAAFKPALNELLDERAGSHDAPCLVSRR